MNILRNTLCPSCLNQDYLEMFYQIKDTPIHQNRIYRSLDSAVNCKRGNISLTFCQIVEWFSIQNLNLSSWNMARTIITSNQFLNISESI